jgi:hypothetical protein
MKMKLNFRAVVISGALLAGGAAAPAYADPLDDFVKCVNSTSPRTVDNVVACVPAHCSTTVTMSEESAQPACKLKDGTRLPRVIFSCPGASGSLNFRPSFSLCTQAGTINHIEVGQDVNQSTRTDDPELKNFPHLQKMADFDLAVVQPPFNFQEFGAGLTAAVLDAKTPANTKACAECHDRLGTLPLPGFPAGSPSGTANTFLPIPPAVADGTIFTNDPTVDGFTFLTFNPFSGICNDISHSVQLKPALKDLAGKLCIALGKKGGLLP